VWFVHVVLEIPINELYRKMPENDLQSTPAKIASVCKNTLA
jgi:hypothetical protein